MSRWAASKLSLPEVLGIVEADNVGSCRVLEKAGYVRGREEAKQANGRVLRIVVYRYSEG